MLGALLSGATGFIGMNISVRANVRTAEAARTSLQSGLTIAFRAGAITGMLVAGLALARDLGLLLVSDRPGGYAPNDRASSTRSSRSRFGASLISIFARLGGGIFTKAADVGADLVGKVEAGIPEDDPRNPAVIADNVGDNVGDCAGMAADLFETYVVTVGVTMVLDRAARHGAGRLLLPLMSLPLLIGGVCIITSIIGTYMVRLGKGIDHGRAVQGLLDRAGSASRSPAPSSSCSAAISTSRRRRPRASSFTGDEPLLVQLLGLAVTALIVWITEYYTGTNYRPVQSIARASQTGHGTNVIQGLASALK